MKKDEIKDFLNSNIGDLIKGYFSKITMREGLTLSGVGLDMINDIICEKSNFTKLKPTELNIIIVTFAFARAAFDYLGKSDSFKKNENRNCGELLAEMWKDMQSGESDVQEAEHQ